MDVREQLRQDHAKALAELDGVARETDARRGQARLARLRRAWMVHALAEETVVYRRLEGTVPTRRADERFVEHEVVARLFDKVSHVPFGRLEWYSRLKVVRDVVTRHAESKEGGLFVDLSERFSAEELMELGQNFVLARDKLTLLEEAKKAA